MTLDERIQFLVQSTESLHATVHEMTEQIQQHTGQIQQHTEQLRIDAENIRGLARIAELHSARLDDLDERTH